MNSLKHYKYKNLSLLLLSIVLTAVLSKNESFHSLLLHLGNLGYIGAFIGGILFVSTFTVTIGILILLILAENLSHIEIGLIAGIGAVLGDMTIFQIVKNRGLIDEIKSIFKHFGGDKLNHLLHTKYFSWLTPVMGALIIASPLPDEIGVSLLGISKMKTYQFLLLSFTLNTTGIILVLTASTIVKP